MSIKLYDQNLKLPYEEHNLRIDFLWFQCNKLFEFHNS